MYSKEKKGGGADPQVSMVRQDATTLFCLGEGGRLGAIYDPPCPGDHEGKVSRENSSEAFKPVKMHLHLIPL